MMAIARKGGPAPDFVLTLPRPAPKPRRVRAFDFGGPYKRFLSANDIVSPPATIR